jgi:gag-polypeptide of LTR copia-type
MSMHKNEKTITLKQFQPDGYLIWKMQAEATFRVHGLLEIIKGTEKHPVNKESENGGDTEMAMTEAEIDQIHEYERRHDRAYQALINSLDTADAIKVYTLTSAHEIWMRLEQEYGQISEIRRTTALHELYSLRKDQATSMDDHIRKFTKLQMMADYHRPPTNPPMNREDINLIFMTSLGDKWKVYRQAMGTRVTAMTTAQLFAEIRALETEDKGDEKEEKPAGEVLMTKGQHPGAGRTKQKHRNGKPYDRNNKKGKKRWHPGMKGYKKCDFCEKEGHLEADCFKKRCQDNNNSSNHNSSKNEDSHGSGPGFGNYGNFAMCIKVLSSTHKRKANDDEHGWIIDSAANINLTPHKNRLKRYSEFAKPQKVSGLGGSLSDAHGVGYVTLRDEEGRTHGGIRVLYVPDAEYPILSLMNLRQTGLDFQFTGEETFTLAAKGGFNLSGYSEDNILHIRDSCRLVSLMMTTRGAKKRRTEALEDEAKKGGEENVTNREINENVILRQPITSKDLVPNQEGDLSAVETSPETNTQKSPQKRRTPPNL